MSTVGVEEWLSRPSPATRDCHTSGCEFVRCFAEQHGVPEDEEKRCGGG
ncbi:MAG: hypothetical protein OXH09_00375 [Gammaproteobacteria bacterium]|nr:hypothetical protein [Gammaproteobacteria bacterium]